MNHLKTANLLDKYWALKDQEDELVKKEKNVYKLGLKLEEIYKAKNEVVADILISVKGFSKLDMIEVRKLMEYKDRVKR